MLNTGCAEERYLDSCRTRFWQKVFRYESEYLDEHLHGCRDVLSVGCGPASVEGELSKRGYVITGLDVSAEALGHPPDAVRTLLGRAESLPFRDRTFDAVIFVASLQFIRAYRKALEESARVLRTGGRLIVMLLNTRSDFFKDRMRRSSSYVRKIRHRDLDRIEAELSRRYHVRGEYSLGVRGERIFTSRDPAKAALYILRGALR